MESYCEDNFFNKDLENMAYVSFEKKLDCSYRLFDTTERTKEISGVSVDGLSCFQ